MKHRIQLFFALAALLALPLSLNAQDEPDSRRGDRSGEFRRGERRGASEGRRGGFRRGMDAMYERIAKELQLDEAQQAEFDEIRAAQRERGAAAGEEAEGSAEE